MIKLNKNRTKLNMEGTLYVPFSKNYFFIFFNQSNSLHGSKKKKEKEKVAI